MQPKGKAGSLVICHTMLQRVHADEQYCVLYLICFSQLVLDIKQGLFI